MTPRHLAIFCLAQLGCITAGILCAYKGVRLHLFMMGKFGTTIEIPAATRFFVSFGWLLLLIPIACVLLVPRHREDESSGQADWRWGSIAATAAGVAALVFPPFFGIITLLRGLLVRW